MPWGLEFCHFTEAGILSDELPNDILDNVPILMHCVLMPVHFGGLE
jgi:hypothetical protein